MLEVLRKKRISLEALVTAYLGLKVNGLHSLKRRPTKFYNTFSKHMDMQQLLNHKKVIPGELLVTVNLKTIRRKLTALSKKSNKNNELCFGSWSKATNPAELQLTKLPNRLEQLTPTFYNMISYLCAKTTPKSGLLSAPSGGTLAIMTSIVLRNSQPHASNMFAHILGLHISNLGLNRQGLQLLHRFDIIKSCDNILKSRKQLNKHLQNQLKQMGKSFNKIFIWDNFDWHEKLLTRKSEKHTKCEMSQLRKLS